MTIDVPIPPLNLTQEAWESLGFPDRALLFAAQECDVFHAEEAPRGSNSGQRVNEYLRSAHSTPRNPWCAAFVTWCCRHAGWDPFGPDVKEGVMYPSSAVSWIIWAKLAGRVKKNKPVRGDLFFFDKPGETHIGFVVHADVTTVQTLEGNVNAGRIQEGFEVVRRKLPTGQPTGYISLKGLKCNS